MELKLDADANDLHVWLQEAEEQLQVLDESIIRLEKEADDEALLQQIFRAAHTLKGSSASIKHTRMANLTHAMEGVLDALRNRRISATSELIDALLRSLDNLALLRDEAISLAVNESVQLDDLIANLNLLKETRAVVMEAPPADAAGSGGAVTSTQAPASRLQMGPAELERARAAELRGERLLRMLATLVAGCSLPAARKLQVLTEAGRLGEVIVSEPTMDAIMAESAELWIEALLATREDEGAIRNSVNVILDVESILVEPFGLVVEEEGVGAPEPTAGAAPVADGGGAAGAAGAGPAQRAVKEATTVRVDVERLDNLMNLVGELVIDKTRLERLGSDLSERFAGEERVASLIDATAHLGRITDELQEEVMRS